jgi:hypothetical protein
MLTVAPPHKAQPPPLRDFAARRTGAPGDGLPSELATLENARRGQVMEVRAVIDGAGESAAMLRPGDRVICRGRTSQWIVVELPGRGEYAVHRHDARFVRIDRRHG